MSDSLSEFSLFGIWIEIVFKFQFNNLFLSFTHLLVKSFKSLFQHCDGLFEWLNSFWEGLFNQDSTNDFPTFSITFEWFNIGQNKGILSSFVFEFKISFEDFSVLSFDFIIIVHDLLWDWHFELKFLGKYLLSLNCKIDFFYWILCMYD